MKVLIVGGTGMIGDHAARYLRDIGHEVSIGARQEKPGDFPVVRGDYIEQSFTLAQLRPFDAVIFAAGQDVRHHRGADDDGYWRAAQTDGVPAFARLARAAGVRRFVQIGSYYHVVMPELAATNPYVRARLRADEDTRALAGADFHVSTINPPSIVGAIRGTSLDRYRGLFAWARGTRPEIPLAVPPGGTNYMSARALAEAIGSALERTEPGHAYLVGDENLSFRAFFQRIFDLAGSGVRLDVRDAPHPLLPDNFLIQGRGVTVAYDPPANGHHALAYARGGLDLALKEIMTLADADAVAGQRPAE